MEWIPDAVGERYRILAKIGESSATEVFKALDMRLGRTVALKTLREGYLKCPTVIQGLENEAHALARVPHGNIVRLYDYDEAEMRPFIVMEYVPGKKLTDLLSEHASMSEEENNRLAWQLLKGLSAVRRAGLVYGNVLLHNVLVHRDGILKISGLGTSKANETGDADETGMGFSHPQYRAVRVASHGEIHAVESLMHRFLSGVLLYESDDWLEAVARGVDAVEWTLQKEAEEWWPSNRHVLDASVQGNRAEEMFNVPRAASADWTRAMPVVAPSNSEADTIRLTTVRGTGASRAAMAPRRSSLRSLFSLRNSASRTSSCARISATKGDRRVQAKWEAAQHRTCMG